MAPMCECGHKASEHHKQMGLRTYCKQSGGTAGGAFEESWDCPCPMYRAKEGE